MADFKITEVREAAKREVIEATNVTSIPGVRQIGPSEYAIPTNQTDAEGKTIYVAVTFTAKNNKGSEGKRPVAPFDVDAAEAAYREKVSEAERKAQEKAAEKAKKEAEKSAKKDAE